MTSYHKALLEEYIEHYKFERESIIRSFALKDEIQKRAMWFLLEMIDFEILAAQEEVDLFNANQQKLWITHKP